MILIKAVINTVLIICALMVSIGGINANELNPLSYRFNIPAQTLDTALIEFSIQADVNIVGLTTEIKDYQTPAVIGRFTQQQALTVLLKNTHLNYQVLNNNAVSFFVVDESTVELAETATQESVLEEVVISATRREADLQDTPIAVTALKQDVLEQNQVKDLRDITDIVPGLVMVNTGPQAAILVQLRGVGTTNITEIADGPVAIHVDGVYSPRSQGAAALLYDVDRVEVLRGPQGTLFGRNSSSGSINVYNRKPVFNRKTADLSITLGDYNHRVVKTAINLPFNNMLAFRLATAQNKHDAYTQLLDNYLGLGKHYPLTEADLNDYDRALDLGQKGPETANQTSWRLSALWQPSDQLSAWLSVENYQDTGTGVAELDPGLVERGIRGVVQDSPSFLKLRNDVLRSNVEYHFNNDYTLSYILGLSEMSRRQIFDADHGRDGSFEQQRTDSSTFRFYSHEIQLLNSDMARLRWVFGAFASEEKNEIVFAVEQQNAGGGRFAQGASSWISNDEGAAVSYAIQPDRRVESLGLFAQATYDLDDYNRLTLGFRYTDDTKSDRGGRAISCRETSVLGPYHNVNAIAAGGPNSEQLYADTATLAAIAAGLPHDNGSNTGIAGQPCWIRQVNDFSANWNNISGLLRYNIDLGKDVLLYSSVATGFKSGHIQDAGNSAAPETVINYELGVKSQLLNDSLRINAALYRADYDDLQFSNQDRLDINNDGIADTGGSTVVRNASKATIQGLELELEWALYRYGHVQLAATLMDAHFDEFEIPDTLFGNIFNPTASPHFNRTTDNVILSGNSPPITPDWKFVIAYEHDIHFEHGILTPRVLMTFSDEYFLDIYNRNELASGTFDHLPNGGKALGLQESYQTFDASLRFAAKSNKWSINAYVKNLTDENIKIASGNFITENGFVAIYMPPRTYGLTVNYALGQH